MKKIALYIMLFCYSVIIIKPVVPYVADAVAHVFYYSQHMATIHYENGKLHVHQELIDENEQSPKQSEAPVSKNDKSITDHISISNTNDETIAANSTMQFVPLFVLFHDHYLQGDFPPPRI